MHPGFDTDGFKQMQEGYASATCDVLIKKVIELNEYICKDDALGAGFQIGHSYFCGVGACTEEWLKAIVYYDIFPTLQEYWFDDKEKVRKWENTLSGVFNDQ